MSRKGKQGTRVVTRPDHEPSLDCLQHPHRDLFRHYFESRFEPLTRTFKYADQSAENPNHSSRSSSPSEWEGFSDDVTIPQVDVVEYEEREKSSHVQSDRQCGKGFMSAKVPLSEDFTVTRRQKGMQDQSVSEETAAEAVNLKNDLELQRLLKESHLLDAGSGSTLTHIHRHKAIDMRIQSLGGKFSLFTQSKMPPSHRRGIAAKAQLRESNRRKEAKENGIILEKEAKSKRSRKTKRDRGIGGPAIGKFQGGTLKLSRKDISSIRGQQKR